MIDAPSIKLDLNYEAAVKRLHKVVNRTPLQLSESLSRYYHCNVYLKREDLQPVRSYKIRGAYNMMSSLLPNNLQKALYVPVQEIMPRDLHSAVKNLV